MFLPLIMATLAAPPPAMEWQPLIAHDIATWTVAGGNGSFVFEDGELHGFGPTRRNTFLVSPKTHRDFVLECEVLAAPATNSGVQIRSRVDGAGRLRGPQIEIDTSDRRWSGGLYDEGGRGWLDPLEGDADALAAFKVGTWNTYRIECLGPRYRSWVNGTLCADFIDTHNTQGRIAFQVHSGDTCDVRWRNLRIANLGDVDIGPDSAPEQPPSNAEVLFGGTSLEGWSHAKWTLVDDAMEVAPGTGDLQTKAALPGGVLHVEFRTPNREVGQSGQDRGNSGVYVQGRYEIQILDSPGPDEATDRECGAIYAVAPPRRNAARQSQQWQSYLIHFRQPEFDADNAKTAPARVTVYHNGILIHDDHILDGPTGAGGPESPEPAPLRLQDHGHRVQFRNIWWVPLP